MIRRPVLLLTIPVAALVLATATACGSTSNSGASGSGATATTGTGGGSSATASAGGGSGTGGTGTGTGATGGTGTGTGTGSSSGAPTLPPAPAGAVYVTQADNGKTISVPAGDEVLLVLYSTYWQKPAASNASVLTAMTKPRIAPPPMPLDSICSPVPGSGCGLKVYAYNAASVGSTVISTSRSSCGEAMACTGSNAKYSATVNVVQTQD